jgi:hypothetical protein
LSSLMKKTDNVAKESITGGYKDDVIDI